MREHLAHCLLCHDHVMVPDLVLHMHRIHPDVDAFPDLWPDGEIVAWDETEEFA